MLLLFNISSGNNNHSRILVLSSSPNGRFVLIQKKENNRIYIFDMNYQDTLRCINHNSKIFLGWKNDTSFYCINEYNGNKVLIISNVYNFKDSMIKPLNAMEISILEDSLSATPNTFEKAPFLVFVDSKFEKIYRYNFLNSTLDTLFDLSEYFYGDQIVNLISVNSIGEILLNISSNNYNGIYYFSDKKISEINLIDSSEEIVFDSYCFFDNSGNELLYYKYYFESNKIARICLIKRNLSTGITQEYSLPSGFVPSSIVDLPNNRLFIVNGVATNDNYTISIKTSSINTSPLEVQKRPKEFIFDLINKYFNEVVNNYDIIQVPYNN